MPHEASSATLIRADSYFKFLSGTYERSSIPSATDLAKADQTPSHMHVEWKPHPDYPDPDWAADDAKTRLVRPGL